MENLMNYIKPELIVVAIVLYFIGVALKATETFKDKYIPLTLGGFGIVICLVYTFATSDIAGSKDIAMAIFTSFTQGVLVAGLSNYVDQLIKQTTKDE